MTPPRPHPALWQPIAQLLLALRVLLQAAHPGSFAAMAAQVCRELRLSGAMVRRYLFVLARDIPPPTLRPLPARDDPCTVGVRTAPHRRKSAFDPGERAASGRAASPGAPADAEPGIAWALALQSAEALLAVLRDPMPAARRLAARLARGTPPPLRDLPVPPHVLRAIPPALDALLMRLDSLARPDAWAGMHPDTG